MKRSELKELLRKHTLLECDLEDAIEFVNELLYMRRKEIERNEPYAVNTMNLMETAEHEVWDLLSYVEEMEDDVI